MNNELLALTNFLTIAGALLWFISGVINLRKATKRKADFSIKRGTDFTIQIKRKRNENE